MWLSKFRWPLLLLSLTSLTACVTTTPQQEKVIIVHPVVTPVPPDRDVILVPKGALKCSTVEGRWFYSTWIPQHKICLYKHKPGQVVWISGYWACKSVSQSGQCLKWAWKPSHWHNKMVVY